MKKLTAFLMTLILIFSMIGCNGTSSDANDDDIIKSYCYVTHVKSNGFVADLDDVGAVFIKYAGAKKQIEIFDTVVIEYYASDLIEKDGSFTGFDGEKVTYSYKLKKPQSVRAADSSKGEPVFG